VAAGAGGAPADRAIHVHVQLPWSDKAPLTLSVPLQSTVGELKRAIRTELDLDEGQSISLTLSNKPMAKDSLTLLDYNVAHRATIVLAPPGLKGGGPIAQAEGECSHDARRESGRALSRQGGEAEKEAGQSGKTGATVCHSDSQSNDNLETLERRLRCCEDELEALLVAHGGCDAVPHRTFGARVDDLYREMAYIFRAVSATIAVGAASASTNESPKIQAMTAAFACAGEGPEPLAAHDVKRAPSDGAKAQASHEEVPMLQFLAAASPRKSESESGQDSSAPGIEQVPNRTQQVVARTQASSEQNSMLLGPEAASSGSSEAEAGGERGQNSSARMGDSGRLGTPRFGKMPKVPAWRAKLRRHMLNGQSTDNSCPQQETASTLLLHIDAAEGLPVIMEADEDSGEDEAHAHPLDVVVKTFGQGSREIQRGKATPSAFQALISTDLSLPEDAPGLGRE
jgi:hypothetical protein